MEKKWPNNLKTIMNKAGVSVADLVKSTGIPRQNIHRWRNGERKLNQNRAEELARHLGVTAQELMFSSNPASPTTYDMIDQAVERAVTKRFDKLVRTLLESAKIDQE